MSENTGIAWASRPYAQPSNDKPQARPGDPAAAPSADRGAASTLLRSTTDEAPLLIVVNNEEVRDE